MSAQELSVTLDGRMPAEDAATYLDLKPKTLAMFRVYGSGPPFVKTGRISYFKSDLDDWIKARRVTSTAELEAKKSTGEVARARIPRPNNRRSDARKKAPAKPAGKSGRRVGSKGRRRVGA
jgi:hypothetical protein